MKKKNFVVAMVVIASLVYLTGCDSAQEEKTAVKCLQNQRMLLGAVEMYNMDKEKKITKFEKSMAEKDGVLVKGFYLKDPIEAPGDKCRYTSTGNLSEGGVIYCEVHDDFLKLRK
ncbi:MAG: hypothetical protein ACQETH_09360 [Candidatus Rifleibacteriota bacterium]